MSAPELILRLLLQLAAILLACRVAGAIGRSFRQPQVVCEMLAGIVLGPSVLGWLAPDAAQMLFPSTATGGGAHPSMLILNALGQLGVVLYMFLVGIEVDPQLLRRRVRGAGAVSVAGIVVPFALGAAIAIPLAARGDLFAPGISGTAAAIYLGSAMAITAFPMLARILEERGIFHTEIGSLTLAAGAVNDAIAWCLLAFTLGVVKKDASLGLVALLGGLVLFVLTVKLVKPWLARAVDRFAPAGRELPPATFPMVLAALMLWAWCGDLIGVHAVFGAFTLGLAIPRGRLAESLRDRISPLTGALLLPVFFTYSGLNTSLQLIHGVPLWTIAVVLLLAACAGKALGCALAARWTGSPWHEAFGIGALMNARGLMELVILNLGLQHGLINGTLFTMMVLVAVATTVLASPLFAWSQGLAREAAPKFLQQGLAPGSDHSQNSAPSQPRSSGCDED